jgi:hypothetical protein
MTVQPADCLARAQYLLAELDLVRLEMGRQPDARPRVRFEGAAPREVFFEAAALFRKADRLCFERTGEEGALPYPPPVAEIQPVHVKEVIDAAINRIAQVKSQLRITETSAAVAPQAGKQPSDVLEAVFSASRQLNKLLEQPFSPNDVYQLMTLAAGYAVRLVAHTGRSIPALPSFERKQRPADCYRRAWSCLEALYAITARSGLAMLKPGTIPYTAEDIQPSDVYDLTSLLVSELVYLHSCVPGLAPPAAAEMYEVGHKLPSHVYQRAGQVESALRELKAVVEIRQDALRT